jgi:hypothetical protein
VAADEATGDHGARLIGHGRFERHQAKAIVLIS